MKRIFALILLAGAMLVGSANAQSNVDAEDKATQQFWATHCQEARTAADRAQNLMVIKFYLRAIMMRTVLGSDNATQLMRQIDAIIDRVNDVEDLKQVLDLCESIIRGERDKILSKHQDLPAVHY